MAFPFIKLTMLLVKYGQELFLGQPPEHQRRRKTDLPYTRLESIKKFLIWLGAVSIIGCIYLTVQLYNVSSRYSKLLHESKKPPECEVKTEAPAVEPPTAPAPLLNNPPASKPAIPIKPPRASESTDPDAVHHQQLMERLRELDKL